MNYDYGDVALGVEAALPAFLRPDKRVDCARRYLARLISALRRWG